MGVARLPYENQGRGDEDQQERAGGAEALEN
jgi:hypothetical protein